MVSFSSLKSHVNSSNVQDSATLRLDRPAGQDNAKVKLGGFFGRAVERFFPGEKHASSPEENFKVKTQVLDSLMGKFSDHVLNQTSSLINWSPEKPLTVRDVRVLIKTAETLQKQPKPDAATTSNQGTAHFGDGNRLGDTQRLGAGAVNEVFINSWLHRSEETQMVFKPIGQTAPDNFNNYGIATSDGDNGNIAGRNVASYETAHALGMPTLITATNHTSQNGQEGIIMAKADGISVFNQSGRISLSIPLNSAQIDDQLASWNNTLAGHGLIITGHGDQTVQIERLGARDECARIVEQIRAQAEDLEVPMTADGTLYADENTDINNYNTLQGSLQEKLNHARNINMLPLDGQNRIDDGDLNLKLNQMQWLDFICGQGDRNPANIFIRYDKQGDALDVTGIDNDTSFGEYVDKDGIMNARTGAPQSGTAFQSMPDAISKHTAERVSELSTGHNRDKFEAMLQANNLSPNEVAQALYRLDQAKEQIDQWRQADTLAASPNGQTVGQTGRIIGNDPQAWQAHNTSGYSAYYASAATKGVTADPRMLQNLLRMPAAAPQ